MVVVATFLFACLQRGRDLFGEKKMKNENDVTCDDGFGEEAAWLVA